MNLQEVWKKLEMEKLEVGNPSNLNPWATRSKHPVVKLRNAYQISTFFSATFLLAFVFLFFAFDQTLVKIGLGITIAHYIFFFATNFSMYRKIRTDFPFDGNLKSVLKNTHIFITDNIRFQERTALFIYPFAGTTGFLMGAAASGANVAELLQEPVAVWALVIFLVIATPLSWLLARWLYKISYGVCLAQLRQLIDEMEKPQPSEEAE
jgi:hypothetical protein